MAEEYLQGTARGGKKIQRNYSGDLIDFNSMCAIGNCQSCQAMRLYYGVFEESEQRTAFEKLLEMIHEKDARMDVGVPGGRVIFHVLSLFGKSDLTLKIITHDDFPSYGNLIKRGATTLWEKFSPDITYSMTSMHHRFQSDIKTESAKNPL